MPGSTLGTEPLNLSPRQDLFDEKSFQGANELSSRLEDVLNRIRYAVNDFANSFTTVDLTATNLNIDNISSTGQISIFPSGNTIDKFVFENWPNSSDYLALRNSQSINNYDYTLLFHKLTGNTWLGSSNGGTVGVVGPPNDGSIMIILNSTNLTVHGSLVNNDGTSYDHFPPGTRMVFQQTNAPTGWVKDTSLNDRALRVVSGAVGTGGTVAFSTIFGAGRSTDGHVLSVAEMPSHDHGGGNHQHSFSLLASGGTGIGYAYPGYNTAVTYYTAYSGNIIAAQGSGAAHSHTMNMNVAYVDIIVAQKS